MTACRCSAHLPPVDAASRDHNRIDHVHGYPDLIVSCSHHQTMGLFYAPSPAWLSCSPHCLFRPGRLLDLFWEPVHLHQPAESHDHQRRLWAIFLASRSTFWRLRCGHCTLRGDGAPVVTNCTSLGRDEADRNIQPGQCCGGGCLRTGVDHCPKGSRARGGRRYAGQVYKVRVGSCISFQIFSKTSILSFISLEHQSIASINQVHPNLHLKIRTKTNPSQPPPPPP